MADNLPELDFTREVIAILQVHRPELKPQATGDGRTVMIGDMRVSLDNLIILVRDLSGEERRKAICEFIDKLVAGADSKPEAVFSYSEAKARIRPQLVPAEFLHVAPAMLHRPFFSGLVIAFALDEGDRYDLLQETTLETWGVSLKTLQDQAMANLEMQAETSILQPKRSYQGSYVVAATGDSYDAARLILPHFMARVRRSLGASTVYVGIPNRDFIVAWTQDFDGRKTFAAKIRRDRDTQPYPLTEDIFVSADNGIRQLSMSELFEHGR